VPGIAVLGPMLVVSGDAPRSVRSSRQRLLLALLASRGGHAVEADVLVDALWGEDLPDHPAAALHSQVFRLRKLLGSVGCTVETEGTCYRLECSSSLLDAARFEALVTDAEASASEPAVAAELLEQALGLWRGRAFGEVAEHAAIRRAAAHLDDLRVRAIEQRASALLRLGRATDAAHAAERLIVEHPYREEPVALRMRALAAEGRHAEALDNYQRFRSVLGEELGLEPSPELRTLEGEILRHETPPSPSIGLPGNSLVGRVTDLAAIVGVLEENRVVTPTGPGGVGKSRLGVHVADEVGAQYPDGVWICELATVDRSDAVASTIAATLEIQPQIDEPPHARVVRFLRQRRALLVFDRPARSHRRPAARPRSGTVRSRPSWAGRSIVSADANATSS
jgi:DNA-binding SARP family transcriptional activator